MDLIKMRQEVEIARVEMEKYFDESVKVQQERYQGDGYTQFSFYFLEKKCKDLRSGDIIGFVVFQPEEDQDEECIAGICGYCYSDVPLESMNDPWKGDLTNKRGALISD